jgi:hypothetical protein
MLEENGGTWQLNMASPALFHLFQKFHLFQNSIRSTRSIISSWPEMFHLVPLVPKIPFVPKFRFVPSVPLIPFSLRCSISFHLFRMFHSVPGVPLVPEIPFVPLFSLKNLTKKWNMLIINCIAIFLHKMEQVERVEHGTERNDCG